MIYSPRAIVTHDGLVFYSLRERFLNELSHWIFIPSLWCWYLFHHLPLKQMKPRKDMRIIHSLSPLWVTDAGLRSLSWPFIWKQDLKPLHLGEMVLQGNVFFLKEERDQNQQAEAGLLRLTSHLKEDLYCTQDNIIAAAARTTHGLTIVPWLHYCPTFAQDTHAMECCSPQGTFPGHML